METLKAIGVSLLNTSIVLLILCLLYLILSYGPAMLSKIVSYLLFIIYFFFIRPYFFIKKIIKKRLKNHPKRKRIQKIIIKETILSNGGKMIVSKFFDNTSLSGDISLKDFTNFLRKNKNPHMKFIAKKIYEFFSGWWLIDMNFPATIEEKVLTKPQKNNRPFCYHWTIFSYNFKFPKRNIICMEFIPEPNIWIVFRNDETSCHVYYIDTS